MKKLMAILFCLFVLQFAFSIENPNFPDVTSVEILNKVDLNNTPDSLFYNGTMNIIRGRSKRVKRFSTYIKGKNTGFTEFTYPSRDAGTKYLRRDDKLWMYLPGADRTVRISGHMLRRSMMGSDFSYEDQTDNDKLSDIYNSYILRKDSFDSQECYVLELTAKEDVDTTYYKRILYVEMEKFIPVRSELYSRSDRLLKTVVLTGFKNYGKRWYPSSIRIDDNLRKGNYTEVIMEDLKLDHKLPDKYFTLEYIERKEY